MRSKIANTLGKMFKSKNQNKDFENDFHKENKNRNTNVELGLDIDPRSIDIQPRRLNSNEAGPGNISRMHYNDPEVGENKEKFQNTQLEFGKDNEFKNKNNRSF